MHTHEEPESLSTVLQTEILLHPRRGQVLNMQEQESLTLAASLGGSTMLGARSRAALGTAAYAACCACCASVPTSLAGTLTSAGCGRAAMAPLSQSADRPCPLASSSNLRVQ